jgi:inner membrane protein
MVEFLQGVSYYEWLSLGVALLLIDVLVTGVGYLVWMGVAAILVAVAQYASGGLWWASQYLLFAVLSVLSAVLWRMRAARLPELDEVINNPAVSLLGRSCQIHEAIVAGRGKIRLRDSVWIVTGEDMPAGTAVKIVGLDGAILQVAQVD